MLKKHLFIGLAIILTLTLCACGIMTAQQPIPLPSAVPETDAPQITAAVSSSPETGTPEPSEAVAAVTELPEVTASAPPSQTAEPPSASTPAPASPSPTPAANVSATPSEKPAPVEPQSVTKSTSEYTCTLSVRCDTILGNMDKLDSEKIGLVPEDGFVFSAQTVIFYEGESVFNVLQREMKRNKIHMEFRNTPIHNSAYIMGIGNLYEFDCGELSGWMYKVNGWFPNYGCSRYQLQDGDTVEWVYSCDLGRDVGGGYAAGKQ